LFKEGWRFEFHPAECRRCDGACCIGEQGYVWVSDQAIERIAAFLELDREVLVRLYLRRVGRRYTIVEHSIGPDNHACAFFDVAGRRCSIYPVRPTQCSTFPFWERFRAHPEEAARECPGVRLL
jgi:Fe-S-cluster containining protein